MKPVAPVTKYDMAVTLLVAVVAVGLVGGARLRGGLRCADGGSGASAQGGRALLRGERARSGAAPDPARLRGRLHRRVGLHRGAVRLRLSPGRGHRRRRGVAAADAPLGRAGAAGVRCGGPVATRPRAHAGLLRPVPDGGRDGPARRERRAARRRLRGGDHLHGRGPALPARELGPPPSAVQDAGRAGVRERRPRAPRLALHPGRTGDRGGPPGPGGHQCRLPGGRGALRAVRLADGRSDGRGAGHRTPPSSVATGVVAAAGSSGRRPPCACCSACSRSRP